MKMYCVEHAENDSNNSYYKSKAEAIRRAEDEVRMMKTGEIQPDEVWVTVGEMVDGDYSATEAIYFAIYGALFKEREELKSEVKQCLIHNIGCVVRFGKRFVTSFKTDRGALLFECQNDDGYYLPSGIEEALDWLKL